MQKKNQFHLKTIKQKLERLEKYDENDFLIHHCCLSQYGHFWVPSMPIVDAGLILLWQYLQVVLANLDGPDVLVEAGGDTTWA